MNFSTTRLSILAVAMILITAVATLAGDDIAEHRSCSHCGMDRKAYGYSRALISYGDGAQVGVCSLQCAVTEMNENRARRVTALQVADRDTHLLIPAETAHWVMGGTKRGVMTQRPKWAFATAAAARAFIDAHGGTVTAWVDVLKAAQEDAGPRKQIR